uniref:Uncharacterized protein n=1 Tax=Alexandrium catenella TaxID=2925 RepID=A0A7S1LSM6_ALECA
MARGERQRSVALADRLLGQQLDQLKQGEAMNWLAVTFDSLELEPEYAGMKLHMLVRYGSNGNYLEQASIRVASTKEEKPSCYFDMEALFPYNGTIAPVVRFKLQREGLIADWTIAKTAIHLPFRVGEPGALEREAVFLRKNNSTLVGQMRVSISLEEARHDSLSLAAHIVDTASGMMRRGWSSYSDFVTSYESDRSSRSGSKQSVSGSPFFATRKSTRHSTSFSTCEAETELDSDAGSHHPSMETRTPCTWPGSTVSEDFMDQIDESAVDTSDMPVDRHTSPVDEAI